MKLVLEVFGKPRFEQIALHLLPESHDLPGHFAVLSVIELRRDMGDDFDLHGSAEGIGGHSSTLHREPFAADWRELPRYYMGAPTTARSVEAVPHA